MRVAYFCFIVAALAGLTGMSLGTLALYGLYHRGVERNSNRLAWVQAGSAALGAPLLSGGFAAVLATGTHAPGFIVAGSAGTLLVLLGMVLFVVVLVTDLAAGRSRTRASGPILA